MGPLFTALRVVACVCVSGLGDYGTLGGWSRGDLTLPLFVYHYYYCARILPGYRGVEGEELRSFSFVVGAYTAWRPFV